MGGLIGTLKPMEESEAAEKNQPNLQDSLIPLAIFLSPSSTKTSVSSRIQPPLFFLLRQELIMSHVQQKKRQ